MASTADLAVVAVQRLQGEIQAFAKLKLVFSLELTSGGLMGPGKSEQLVIEVPGPKVSAGEGAETRITLSIPEAMFKVLAEEGDLADWKDAFYYGHLKVGGDPRVKKLLGKAIDKS